MAIKGISIDNFRTFGVNGKPAEFEFAPITILTGPNNSGKSSLIKALLFLKENFENDALKNGEFSFESHTHHLNQFNNVSNKIRDITCDSIKFELDFDWSKMEDVIGNGQIIAIHKIDFKLEFGVIPKHDDESKAELTHLKVWIQSISKKVEESEEFANSGLLMQTLFQQKVTSPPENLEENEFTLPREALNLNFQENHFSSDWLTIKKVLYILAPNLSFDIKPSDRKNISFNFEDGEISLHAMVDWSELKEIDDRIFDFVSTHFKVLDFPLEELLIEKLHNKILFSSDFFKIYHMSLIEGVFHSIYSEDSLFSEEYTNEIIEKMIYTMNLETIPDDLAADIYEKMYGIIKGESLNCIGYLMEFIESVDHFLKTLYSIPIDFEYLSAFRGNPKRIYSTENVEKQFYKIEREFATLVEKWLNQFELKNIRITNLSDFIKIEINDRNINDTSLLDIGFGYSQILPLLLTVINNRAKMIVVEEPESHLHPAFQSKLGDFFVDMIKNNDNSFIIETHSEYLIRKLQFLIAKKEIKPSDVAIYYFGSDPSADDYIRRIDIDDNGFMKGDFGPGFFDEAASLLADLWNIQYRKS